jgi:hypothetical protein
MELEIWRSKKLNSDFSKKIKKIPWCRQYIVIYHCVIFRMKYGVFWAQQIRQLWFCPHKQCIENLILSFCAFYYFYSDKNTTYFVLKIYRMIECNIAYVIVFFQNFLKFLYWNFVNFNEKRTSSLVSDNHLKFLLRWGSSYNVFFNSIRIQICVCEDLNLDGCIIHSIP